MKREASEHPKLLEFADALDALGAPHPRAVARGVLEGLWHFTARFAPAGNVGRFGDRSIARACDWEGDAEPLVAALVACGWIDAHPDHRLVVHDWRDHADRHVHRTLVRRGECFADGTEPTLSYASEPERAQWNARRVARRATSSGNTAGSPPGSPPGNTVGSSACSLPEPEPEPERKKSRSARRSNAPNRSPGKPPDSGALRCAEVLRDELVNSGTSYQAKGDYLRRWAREIERMAGEYSDIRVSDDPWSLIEAGIRHAFSKGYFGTEYAVVIQSGRSLREKWPKLVAAARRRKSSAAGVSAEVIEFGRRYIEGV